MWCCIEPERIQKTQPIMEAFVAGFGGRLCLGEPPDDGAPFVVWGQIWTTLKAVPKALASGRPFYLIDNGYVDPARGGLTGYYRITYCSPSPVFWPDAPASRIPVKMAEWRLGGRHVVLALPGENFGRSFGLDCRQWIADHQREGLRRFTPRPMLTRPKKSTVPLASDLRNAWALVTHSSNVAVDAVLAGVPVFCRETCPAAPVGNLDLANLERPARPERKAWLNSLMAQQYTVSEIRAGLAREYLGAAIQHRRGADGIGNQGLLQRIT